MAYREAVKFLYYYPVTRGSELGFCLEAGGMRNEKCTNETVKQCQLLAVTEVENTQRRTA